MENGPREGRRCHALDTHVDCLNSDLPAGSMMGSWS